MQNFCLSIRENTIVCHHSGNKPVNILLLHPYYKDGLFALKTFSFLKSHATLYAPDLPFHGQSQWKENLYQSTDIAQILDKIIQKNEGPFYVIAHSMGARLYLPAFHKMESPIPTCLFYGPDGFKFPKGDPTNSTLVYGLSKPLRWLFLNTMAVEKITALLYKNRWIPKYVYQFIHMHESPLSKIQLLNHWRSYCAIDSDRVRGIKLLEKPIPLEVYVSKKDQLTPYKTIEKSLKRTPNVPLHVVDGGHFHISSTTQELITKRLFG